MTQHYLYLLQAKADHGTDYRRWWLEEMGPQIAASPDCLALSVNLAVDPPGAGQPYRAETRVGDDYDLTLDLQCPDSDAHARLLDIAGPQLALQSRAVHGYRVTTSVEKNEIERLCGNPAPGYKLVRGFFAHADMPSSAFRRSWDNHVELALKIHGFARYVRYFIDGAVTPGAPEIQGATNLHFASADDVLERYFLGNDGEFLIAHDIRHFIDRGLARVFTREHILKSAS